MTTASEPALKPGYFGLNDLKPGDWFSTGERVVSAELIDAFADLTGDRFEIHMDESAAKRHGFAGRVAHGLLVLSLVDGLKNQSPVSFRAVASLGWEWSFTAPVLAGDRIGVRIAVRSLRHTRHKDRGIACLEFDVTNQRGETVQIGENQLMLYV